jgi:protein-disulfide isomerase
MPRAPRFLPRFAALALLALAACATPSAAPSVVKAPPAPKPQADSEYIPVGDSPVRGPVDALVTLVVFCDFECPYCKKAQPTLDVLRTRYGDDLRIVFKHNPLINNHPSAQLAAEAALAAHAQGRFWEMHDLLFANPRALAQEDLERHAQSLGLDMTRFRDELARHVHLPRIHADQELARHLGADGTPSFVINGTALFGAQPLEAFVQVIDPVLARARSIPERDQVYARMAAEPLPPVARSVRRTRPMLEAAQVNPDKPIAVRPNPKAPSRGNPDARVVVEFFADFECPFSGRHAETMQRLVQAYGDKVRFVWRDFPLPFHENARPAAEAAREALAQQGNEGFWRMHDTLFANARALKREDLERYAQQQGLDMVRFRRVLDLELRGDVLQEDVEAGAAAGVNGTPTTFINGKPLVGAHPFETFQEAINAALKQP